MPASIPHPGRGHLRLRMMHGASLRQVGPLSPLPDWNTTLLPMHTSTYSRGSWPGGTRTARPWADCAGLSHHQTILIRK